jgi:methyl-accepting chemotaxis protein
MALLRRLSGVIVLFFSFVGIASCALVIIGIWVGYQKASQKIQAVSDRIDTGLLRASSANQNVRRALDKALADMRSVDEKAAELRGGGEKGARAARAVRTLIEQKAGPDVDDLGGRLDMLADAAAVASSLLQTIQEVAPQRGVPIDADQLKQRSGEAQRVSVLMRRLGTVLDDGSQQPNADEVTETTSQVELVLQKCQETVDQWQEQIDSIREDLASITRKTITWLTFAAVVVTAIFAWIGLGQICLFARGLRWLRT